MPHLIHSEKRLTFKYKQRFSDNDHYDHNDVVVLKKLGGTYLEPYYANQRDRIKDDRSDASDAGKSYFTVVNMTPEASDKRVLEAIKEEFNTGGCSHTYDCCGCISSYAYTVRKTKKREWYVEQTHSANY